MHPGNHGALDHQPPRHCATALGAIGLLCSSTGIVARTPVKNRGTCRFVSPVPIWTAWPTHTVALIKHTTHLTHVRGLRHGGEPILWREALRDRYKLGPELPERRSSSGSVTSIGARRILGRDDEAARDRQGGTGVQVGLPTLRGGSGQPVRYSRRPTSGPRVPHPPAWDRVGRKPEPRSTGRAKNRRKPPPSRTRERGATADGAEAWFGSEIGWCHAMSRFPRSTRSYQFSEARPPTPSERRSVSAARTPHTQRGVPPDAAATPRRGSKAPATSTPDSTAVWTDPGVALPGVRPNGLPPREVEPATETIDKNSSHSWSLCMDLGTPRTRRGFARRCELSRPPSGGP